MLEQTLSARTFVGTATTLLVAATVGCAEAERVQDNPMPPEIVRFAQSEQPPQKIGEPPIGKGATPGSYALYRMGDQPLTDVTFGVRISTDPGLGNVFWSNKFGFTTHGGYVGLQANADGGGMFLYSMWGAEDARPGDNGAHCIGDIDGSPGRSCRIDKRFVPGHQYLFHLRPDGEGWYQAQVEDTTDRKTMTIGSIEVGAGATIKPDGMVSWVEYWDWNNRAATCLDEPYSVARFEVPRANAGGVTGTVASTEIGGACPKQVEVTVGSDDRGQASIHRLAIGNSVGGRLTVPSGKCLTASASTHEIRVQGCEKKRNQAWVAAADKTLRSDFTCLTAAGSAEVEADTCDGSPAQEWNRVPNGPITNKATERCLTALGEFAALRPCDGSATQQWKGPGDKG
ncbi:RICIN domain-containing protein [Nocardia sp. XZ_19_385]|uniref:RICIN domain-containing protein n=1 Tax=Nocardia sp. XZ_19_385 TaxID=2769488 RepID=UPI00188FB737|nr:RICIN domain-containing protein [Nocardia sp. XZ_19_385]